MNKATNYWDECVFCGCWYCRNFVRYDTRRHSLKEPFVKAWFWFPRFIWQKTYKGTEDKIATFKLWHGFYIFPIPEEGAEIGYNWFRRIKFNYKYLFSK